MSFVSHVDATFTSAGYDETPSTVRGPVGPSLKQSEGMPSLATGPVLPEQRVTRPTPVVMFAFSAFVMSAVMFTALIHDGERA